MNKQTLTIALRRRKAEKGFQDFSVFIASRMGVDLTSKDTDITQQRHNAYLIFRERTRHENIASLPTMKRWFGIGGTSTPDREQIYQMCFAMELSIEETQEYLVYGIHEPSFQVNDYQEVILAYGLYHHCSFAECMDMTNELEIRLTPKMELVQTCGSQMLLEEFQGHRELPWEQFMEWMLERAVYFKGYSKTVLNYFEKYKKLILDYVRKDAKHELDMLLTETDYELWCKLHPFLSAKPEIRIKKYISARNQREKLSKDLQKNIQELLAIAYVPTDTNTLLLAEVFGSNSNEAASKGAVFPSISGMTQKRLSDLLNIPIQKDRFLQVRRAYQYLADMDPQLACPEWIQHMAQEYPRKTHVLNTVGDARAWLENYLRENKRRCLQIGRRDLLPMVLYVAQRRYLESIEHNLEKYARAEALEQFEQLANSTLAACNMSRLSDEYELDAILRLCYQEEEFYSYSELLEVVHDAASIL